MFSSLYWCFILFCNLTFSSLFYIPICRCTFQRCFSYLHKYKAFEPRYPEYNQTQDSNISWKWDFSDLGIRAIYFLMQFENRISCSPALIAESRNVIKWRQIIYIHRARINTEGLTLIGFWVFFLNQSYQVLVSILLFYSVLIAFNSFISMIFFLALYFVHSHIQLLFTEIFHLLYYCFSQLYTLSIDMLSMWKISVRVIATFQRSQSL